jgi:hypothetical protein
MRKSCIVQRPNSRLIVLHEDYIEICDGNMIAAMILSILIYWTDVKLAQREQEQEQRKATGENIPLTSLWIWKSQEGFQHDLLDDKPGMRKVHRSTIATAIKLLKDKKFTQSRRNPHNNIDRTQQYLIDQDAINDAIKALPDCIKSITRMSENVQSNVGNDAMDCTNSDNGLSNFRQTIPEITIRDYDTEITNTEREREGANAPAPASSQSDTPSQDNEETQKPKVVRKTAKPGNKVTPPKRPTQPPITMPISAEVQRILDDWRSLFKRKIVIHQTDIDAAERFVQAEPTREELGLERAWLFSTDDPKKPWYRKIGVSLADCEKNWSKWQSLQEAPQVSENNRYLHDTKPRASVLVSEEQSRKNKARMFEIVAAKQAAAQAKKVVGG